MLAAMPCELVALVAAMLDGAAARTLRLASRFVCANAPLRARFFCPAEHVPGLFARACARMRAGPEAWTLRLRVRRGPRDVALLSGISRSALEYAGVGSATLEVDENGPTIAAETAALVAATVPKLPRLRSLLLADLNLDPENAGALVAAVAVATALTTLDVRQMRMDRAALETLARMPRLALRYTPDYVF